MRSPSVRLLTAATAVGLLLTACGGGDDAADPATTATTATDEAATDEAATTSEPTTDDTVADEDAEEPTPSDDDTAAATEDGDGDDGAAAPSGELATVTATAPDGSTFTLGDFAGEPVLVETFATWCSNCRTQLGDTQTAATEVGDDAVFLVLSVEQDLDPASLDTYAEENGFTDLRFGVLDDASLLALQERFGGAVLTPPSTPKFRVAPDGAVSELTTGYESAEEILASLGG